MPDAAGHPHEATCSCSYATAAAARRVERSLRPEVGDVEGDRTTATVTRDEDTITVTVAAADLVALRAGLNTWAALTEVAEAAGGATAD